jgi:hypothetical protein
LHSIELHNDVFLEGFDDWTKARIIGAFAAAYRNLRFRPAHHKNRKPPMAGSCRAAIDAVGETYRSFGHSPPASDGNKQGGLHFFLRRQLKGYGNLDPATKGQKAITPGILRALTKFNDCEEAITTHQLYRGAFFFAMRSCEYMETVGERRTKKLRLRNFRFFYRRREMPLSSSFLHLADSVTVRFEFQKSDVRDETITMHRTGDPLLCPVIAWTAVIRRILSYPGTSAESHINTFMRGGKLVLLASKIALVRLRAVVRSLGKDALGFDASEVGNHSLRSAAAMAMYLAGVPVYTIMLIGRWSSDAFLRYIRRQVQEFSSGVSRRMILAPDFFTIPDEVPPGPENPRTESGRGLNIGLSAQSRALRPAFALHY